MSDVKSVPDIRFDGFAEPWEQRKLDELCDLYLDLTYSPVDVVDSGDTLVLRSSNSVSCCLKAGLI